MGQRGLWSRRSGGEKQMKKYCRKLRFREIAIFFVTLFFMMLPGMPAKAGEAPFAFHMLDVGQGQRAGGGGWTLHAD